MGYSGGLLGATSNKPAADAVFAHVVLKMYTNKCCLLGTPISEGCSDWVCCSFFLLVKRFENLPECIRDARAFCERYISEIKYGRLAKQRSVRYVIQCTHTFLHLLPPTILSLYLLVRSHTLASSTFSLSTICTMQLLHTHTHTHTHIHTHTAYIDVLIA